MPDEAKEKAGDIIVGLTVVSILFCRKGKQGNIAGPLYCNGKLTLMLSAVPGNPAGQNLAAFCKILTKTPGFLIINAFNFIYTKAAHPFPGATCTITFH
jgi:hypothetical protein